MTSTTLVVHDGAMINHRGESGVLGIGIGNFASEKYPDEKGVETRGATAGLWLVIQGQPETNSFQRVHAGQLFDFHQYRIKVLAVGSDRRSMYVRVEVTDANGSANIPAGRKPAS